MRPLNFLELHQRPGLFRIGSVVISFTAVFAMIAGSIEAGDSSPRLTNPSSSKSENDDPFKVTSSTPKIAFVFFAQTHVLPPESENFRLVSNRDALIEVQAYSKTGANAPSVVAILTLNGKTLELPLKGPSVLPPPPKVDPHVVSHSFKDSFTAAIPKEWVMPGLSVNVEMKERSARAGQTVIDRRTYPALNIGASTRLVMTMFDVHFFGEGKGGDYPQGWLEELQTKLPVAEMELHRVRNIMFNKLVMIPRGGKPAILCGSKKEYEEKSGLKFDGEQSTATGWNAAIKDAAYQRANKFGQKKLYYINIYGVHCGGVAGGFSGVGNGKDVGILLHELGHSWGLPHWTAMNYPYKGNMYGIPGDSDNTPHAGPIWAFDISKLVFIPSTVQENRAFRGTPGNYKRDPMLGGGEGDQEKGYLMRHFSDFSMHRIQNCFERIQVYDEQTRKYLTWSNETGTYSNISKGKYADWVPLERNIDIVTVLANASGVTSEANFVYTPIGPYKGDLVDLIEVSKDIARASQRSISESSSNLCLRVTQNGTARTYMVWGKIESTDDPMNESSLKTFAINLPARNGAVTQVDLLHTPNIFKTGSTDGAKVLFSWKASEHPEVALQKAEYFLNGKPISEPAGSGPAIIAGGSRPATPPAVPATPVAAAPGVPVTQADVKSVAATKFVESHKATVSEAVRTEWFGKLIQKIDGAAKAKKPLKGWITAGGTPGTYPLMGADEKVIKIEIEKNIMDIRWSWLKLKDQTALVKSLVKDDDADSLMMLSVFLIANGQIVEGENVLARAALLDPPGVGKLRDQIK